MNAYLKCLYTTCMENGFAEEKEQLTYYRGCIARRNDAFKRLEASLSPEQIELFEEFETTQAAVDCFETEALFEEAVALGKWMMR